MKQGEAMRATLIVMISLMVGSFSGALAADEPAKPTHQEPPQYPAACFPEGEEVHPPRTVVVEFDVTRDGETEKVRVLNASDPCFADAAVGAVRSWIYEPRRLNGVRTRQEDLVMTFTFVFQGTTTVHSFDARPLKRVTPEYPDGCARTADDKEIVVLEFDVTPEGDTDNIRIVDSTNRCFNGSAIKSVEEWEYRPKIVDGVPALRRNLKTAITFELVYGQSPEHKIRSSLKNKLRGIQRSLHRDRIDVEEALQRLAELEAKYGDSFSRAESAYFYYVRAAVKIDGGDYSGALDDLYASKRNSVLDADTSEVVSNAIIELEAYLEAERRLREQEEAVQE